MIATFLALCLGGVSADPAFDAALAAHQKARTGAATITVESKLDSKTVNNRYTLKYVRPHTMLLDAVDLSAGNARRTFFLSGAKLLVYDRENNELARQEAETKGLLAERAVASLGKLEDAVQAILEPKVLGALFKRYRGASGWKRADAGGESIYVLPSPGGVTKMGFDRRTKMLRRFSVSTRAGYVRWTVVYGKPPQSVAYTPPVYAKPVTVLSGRVGSPKYTDKEARKTAAAAAAAYDRLKHAEFEMVSEGRPSHVWISGARVRQKSADWDWGYDGQTLWIYSKTYGKARRGTVVLGKLGAALDAAGVPVDAHVMQLALRSNPIRMILIPGSRIRKAGTMKLLGVDCEVLEAAAPRLRISACLRRTDHLAASISSDILDDRGGRLGGSERTFKYASVGRPIPAGVFSSQIPAGTAIKPLPKVR